MSKYRVRLVATVGSILSMAVVSIVAHHAFTAEFDADQPLKLEGTVTKTEWINPHKWIHLEVTKPDKSKEEWAIEAGTPNALMRRGLSRDTLKPGTAVVVTGYRAKDGSNRANGRDVTYPDGRQVFIGSSGANTPYENPDKDK